MTETLTELQFTAEDLKGNPFHFSSHKHNGRSKIVLLIDAQVEQSNIGRLQQWVSFVQKMVSDYPVVQDHIEIMPYIHLKNVAALGSREVVRQVMHKVLGQLNLTVESMGDLMVADWDGRGIQHIRLSMTRMQDPNALSPGHDCAEFDTHSLWMLVTDAANRIYSVNFDMPVPDEPQKFADFINDVIAATASSEAQAAIGAAYTGHYAAG